MSITTARNKWLVVAVVILFAAGAGVVAAVANDDSPVKAGGGSSGTTSVTNLDPPTTVAVGDQAPTATGAGVDDTESYVEFSSESTVRVNVGGGAFRDRDGKQWEADSCAGGDTYVSPNKIKKTKDDLLYRARRFEPVCSFAVDPGVYEVTVGWAETYNGTPGYRVFPLVMEGQPVSTIDVASEVGLNTAYHQTFEVAVADGSLDVEARELENRPMIALIDARRTGDLPPPPKVEDLPPSRRPVPPDAVLVAPGSAVPTLQSALDSARPGQTIVLASPGAHAGIAKTTTSGTTDEPITITAVDGAYLECPSPNKGEVARCLQINHPSYRIDFFSIIGGSSNLYMVGDEPGLFIHDIKVTNSVFQGAPEGGTGECIRLKYQAYDVEIANNDISGCGIGKCCDSSKNGEGIYIGTAPEQLEEKNPSPETDRTHDIWIHHNTIRSLNECVEGKEGTHDLLIEYNSCSGQLDEESAAFGSRGGRVGEGNVFRFNLVESAEGACVRFGGDEEPDGSGNHFYGNICGDINGEYGVKQQVEPQGLVCDNTFVGGQPNNRLSRSKDIDPTAGCPTGTPRLNGEAGAGRPNKGV